MMSMDQVFKAADTGDIRMIIWKELDYPYAETDTVLIEMMGHHVMRVQSVQRNPGMFMLIHYGELHGIY